MRHWSQSFLFVLFLRLLLLRPLMSLLLFRPTCPRLFRATLMLVWSLMEVRRAPPPPEMKVMTKRNANQAVIGFFYLPVQSLCLFLCFRFFSSVFRVLGAHDSCFIGAKVFPFRKMSVKFVTPSPKPKRGTQFPELDVGLSGWSGTEDVSFPATPLSPEVVQLGRHWGGALASTMEERTSRQIQ